MTSLVCYGTIESLRGNSMSKVKDITGQKFGNLTAIKPAEYKRNTCRSTLWHCKCSCGNETVVAGTALRQGRIVSCGCSRQDYDKRLKMSQRLVKNAKDVSINKLLSKYKQGAKQRGIGFNLTKTEFSNLIHKPCFYCGEEHSLTVDVSIISESRIFTYNGVDRIDSNLDYTHKNCVPCCKNCNNMKGTLSEDQFKSHIKKLYLSLFKSNIESP